MIRVHNIPTFLKEYQKTQSGIRDDIKDPHYYWWITLDRPILCACRDNPGHTDSSEVAAKVALVNRMYSAMLGRGKWEKYKAEDKVTTALVESNIDKFVQELFKFTTLNDGNLLTVVGCHDRLVNVIHKRLKQYALSFSSKYLSFHFPHVVPIFDSRANTAARVILENGPGKAEPTLRGCPPYEKHCRRIRHLMDILEKQKIKADVKTIDYVLYSV